MEIILLMKHIGRVWSGKKHIHMEVIAPSHISWSNIPLVLTLISMLESPSMYCKLKEKLCVKSAHVRRLF